MDSKKTSHSFSSEVRSRAVRMVQDPKVEYGSEWAAIRSIAAKIGCTAKTLRRWVRQSQGGEAAPTGLTAEALERENRELRQANEILRKASAYFAQAELDRRFKP